MPTHKILSVRQPFAWLIVAGIKRIENRSWRMNYRGPLLIHASLKMHDRPIADVEATHGIKIDTARFQFGGIIGAVDVVDCVERSDDPWFEGPFGIVLANAERFPFTPLRGRVGLFEAEL